ncbi:CRISPR system precrRNA processing endoribonuclease RAMP protein Cas6 [Ornithinimicrobium kibberense]|uniref:CRISPR system precrRNA processing endoribonuclease RAMP protein Cas6 n=1 Tax=Ornithinimicrobium kibberense TaxID=282060 RepID=UPI003619E1EE
MPDTIVRNLHRAWRLWSPIPIPPRPQMWASDLSVVSDVLSAAERRTRGLPSTLKVVSACKGSIVLRATADSDVAEALLRLAPYTGVGSFTLKGMGVTTVDCMGAPRDMRQMRPLTRPAGA